MVINDSRATGKMINDHTLSTPKDSSSNGQDGERVHGPADTSTIAICSMAYRLPGGVTTDEAFWDVLYNGKDMKSRIPASRFNVDGFDMSLGNVSGMKMKHGYFLDNDLEKLDLSMFPSISKNEAANLDPQVRQLLEVVRECLEGAGELNYRGQQVGCYVGAFSDEWVTAAKKETQIIDFSSIFGSLDLFLSSRLSHAFDFKGPCMVIKTGCSASTVALHEACNAIRAGNCTSAIVTGVNLINGPSIYSLLGSSVAILSPEGSSNTFDASANGYGRGEAVNALYVKKLEDAVRDGNPIRAIIRSTATNCDGATVNQLAPNIDTQEAVIRQAYHKAGLDPSDTPYVECHGAGTYSGDPTETTAIGRAFGSKGRYIGSVKPNLGHSESASGLTSIIKAILSLEHLIIPPSIKFKTPNPLIPWEQYNLKVPITPTEWPEDSPYRVSLCNFGMGGSNVHTILEAYRPYQAISRQSSVEPQLLLFSATSQSTGQKIAQNMVEYYLSHKDRLKDMAYTLACRREFLPTRLFTIVSPDSGEAATISSAVKKLDGTPKVIMVFTGQGAQWPRMGHELIQSDEAFRKDILELDMVLQHCANPPTWSMLEQLSRPAELSRIYEAELSQPLCTAIQIALVNALKRVGVTPSIVVGHSSGEIAAAYAAGCLTAHDTILVAFYRGLVSKTIKKHGLMAAIGLGSEAVSNLLPERGEVVIAAENSPQSTTISGDTDSVNAIIAKVNQLHPGVLTRTLKTGVAYHSHHMNPLVTKYEQFLRSEVGTSQPTSDCTFYSTVTGRIFREMFNPGYWADNMVSRVKFAGAVKEALRKGSSGNLVFLEIGPHSQLAGPLRQICVHEGASANYVSTLVRGESDIKSILTTFGKLFQYGVNINFSAIMAEGKTLSGLPAYPWDHSNSNHHSSEFMLAKLHRGCRLTPPIGYLYGSDSKPGLRILEVGAGTGGGTEQILRDLIQPGRNPPYEKYVFTDVSSGFFVKAKDRFAYAPNMEYKTFDISRSPASQGFEGELGTYDVILAFYVVHATPSIKESLENIRELLRPDGHLILIEILPTLPYAGYVFGTLPGWWYGGQDNREWGPAIDVKRWDLELRAGGFTGVDWYTYDVEEPNESVAVIGAQPRGMSTGLESTEQKKVTIMTLDPAHEIPGKLVSIFNSQNIPTTVTTLGETTAGSSFIISTIGIETVQFSFEKHLSSLQTFFKTQARAKTLWLLHPTQINCTSPTSSGELLGAIQVASKEMALINYTLQISTNESDFDSLIQKVFAKFSREDLKRGIINPDISFVVKDGVIMLPRYDAFDLQHDIYDSIADETSSLSTYSVTAVAPGNLNSLKWLERRLDSDELGDDEVEVDTKAFGISFKDILVAMGLLSSPSVAMGVEGAGIVRKVGRNVKEFSVGDRAFFLDHSGITSRHRQEKTLCAKIPDDISFEEFTTTSAFLTAMYALIDIARCKKGQSVLIHSACGGFGHAAVGLCKLLGAEIYITVGNEEKVNYAIEKLKISRNRIFSSRDDSFLEGIMQETDGKGVDIVLNSLSGNLLHASWECVAEFGTMIELGKRDLLGSGRLDLKPFVKNRTYSCIDMFQLMTERQHVVVELLRRTLDLYIENRELLRIPRTDFPANKTEEAVRTLQRGNHIGRIAITIPDDPAVLSSGPAPRELFFDSQGSYIFSGGLGGIGRSTAVWITERGARDVIFLSPHASSSSHATFVQELESMGCRVTRLAGRAENRSDIDAAIAAARGPIKGVFHLAMKLQDDLFSQMSLEDWKAATVPKADGLYNIHEALLSSSQTPDFFFITSSLANLVHSPGQSNYVAGNFMMESFALYRRSLGLPATVLAMAPMGDIGYIADRPKLRDFSRQLGELFYEPEYLKYLEHSITNQKRIRRGKKRENRFQTLKDEGLVYMGLRQPKTSLSDPANRTPWRGDAPMASYHHLRVGTSQDLQGSRRTADKIKSLLGRIEEEPSLLKEEQTVLQLSVLIGEFLFTLIMREDSKIEDCLEQQFQEMGLDSLVLMELGGWWQEVMRLGITPLELASKSTLKELGQHAVGQLLDKYSAAFE